MLEGAKVIDLVDRNGKIVYVNESDTVLDACSKMKHTETGSVLVRNGKGAVTGIITARDLVRKIVALDKEPAMARVGEVMTGHPTAVRPNILLPEAMKLMGAMGICHLPVVDEINGKKEVIGMLSEDDIFAGGCGIPKPEPAGVEENLHALHEEVVEEGQDVITEEEILDCLK